MMQSLTSWEKRENRDGSAGHKLITGVLRVGGPSREYWPVPTAS